MSMPADTPAAATIQWASRAPVREVQEWLPEHLREELSVELLAHRAAMSPRNFARALRTQVGVTPAEYRRRFSARAA
jgi:transcriptional regulator GlxA family with amidase domain